MARNRPEEIPQTLQFLRVGELFEPFAPWRRDEKGKQVYVKLSRGEENSFLFVGTHFSLKAEVQQALMRLVNDGWTVEGELEVSFDGRAEPGTDPYVYQDPLALELGRGLLPLADPQHGTPVVGKLEGLREEIAQEVGLVIPSVRVIDNLGLEPNQYLIRIKDAPTAVGEVFLDRLLVVGAQDVLGTLEGWMTVDPVHRMTAKWIEPEHREKAEETGCLVLGSLAVLMAHVKAVILGACPELLGLQETFELISRLRSTHPVVVEDFLSDRRHLRNVRKVLQSLLAERVPIRDLVSILETAGDQLDRLERVDLVTEQCRSVLARQICSSYVNQEGILRGMALGPGAEKVIQDAIQESERGPVLVLSRDDVDDLVLAVKKTREKHGNPAVIFTDPPSRPFLQRVLSRTMPDLGVLSTSELVQGVRVELCGSVELPAHNGARSDEPPPPPPPKKREGVLGSLKRK